MSEITHKAVLPTWVAVINVILLIAAFVCNLLCLQTADIYASLPVLCSILAILCGAYYCFAGYKKNGSLFYKMFVYIYALSHIFAVVYAAVYCLSPYIVVLNMISYGAVCILAAVKDLGRQRSYLAAAAVVFCQLVKLIMLLIYPEFADQEAILAPVASTLVAVLLGFIVIAKYRDKANRHTS